MSNWYNKYKTAAAQVPTWDDLKKKGPNERPRSYKEQNREFRRRDEYVKEYGWSVPSENAIKRIKSFIGGQKVLEIGSGFGFWAKLLQRAGVHITPTDAFNSYGTEKAIEDKEMLFTNVKNVSSDQAVETFDGSVLFMSWPPFECQWAAAALEQFKGNKLIYVGEGVGGCTADDKFFNILESDWDEIDTFSIPRWVGINDRITFYIRKNQVTAKSRSWYVIAQGDDDDYDLFGRVGDQREATEKEKESVFYDLYERMTDVRGQILTDFLNKHPDEKTQPWNPVPLAKIIKIWKTYMLTRRVNNEDIISLKEIVDQTIHNIVKLYANTELSGHSSFDPSEHFEEFGIDPEKSGFYDWIGNISDCACEPLTQDAVDLMSTKDPAQWIQILDRIFDRVHMRNDLASLFIQGGRVSLDRLSGL